MKIKHPYIYTAVLSILFLILIISTAILFSVSLNNTPQVPNESETIYVYLPETDSELESNTFSFFIKERDGKIGIFDSQGMLLRTLEVYTKTLPEEEQLAIREGFGVSSEKELYSLIEVYSD